MVYSFPPEVIDNIVNHCTVETTFTFMFVSKRYSQLFIYGNEPMVRDHKKYHYVKMYGEFFPKAQIGEKPFRFNNPSYIIYMEARYRHRYTRGPYAEDMVKYIPFDHPKFNKRLLRDKIFMFNSIEDIFKYQTLNSVKRIRSDLERDAKRSGDDPKDIEFHLRMFSSHMHENPHNDVFLYAISLGLKSVFYGSARRIFTSPKRLQQTLDNGIFIDQWSRFLNLSDDVDMYERVYQFHAADRETTLGLHPSCSLSRILKVTKPVAKWCIKKWGPEFFPDVNRSHVLGCKWNMETALYLAKKKCLGISVWEYLKLNELEEYGPQFLKYAELKDMIEGKANLDFIKTKYDLMGKTPELNDALITIHIQAWDFNKEFCEWLLKVTCSTKEELLEITNKDEIPETAIRWLTQE